MRAFAEAYPSEEIVQQLAGQIHRRAFYEAYLDEPIVQEVLAQITWFHNCVLLDKVKRSEERIWYIRENISHGWCRNLLVHQIESGF